MPPTSPLPALPVPLVPVVPAVGVTVLPPVPPFIATVVPAAPVTFPLPLPPPVLPADEFWFATLPPAPSAAFPAMLTGGANDPPPLGVIPPSVAVSLQPVHAARPQPSATNK
jgi:hypothetical protein